jgi:hypothetical protein
LSPKSSSAIRWRWATTWCVCVERWKQSYDAGIVAPVRLEATHEKALEVVTLEMLLKGTRLN